MKRILFYIALIMQIVLILIIGFQDSVIERYGEEIMLKVERDNYKQYESNKVNIYLNYEINKIPVSKWEVNDNASYNEKVYVLLESEDNSIYHVMRASSKKIKAGENQVVLIGKKSSSSYPYGLRSVEYGLENVKDPLLFEGVSSKKSRIATIAIAPWGQTKVISIKNVE